MRKILLLMFALASMANGEVIFAGFHLPSNGLPSIRITIRIVNPAVVEVKTLAQAEKVARQILGTAGIGVVWVDCAAITLAEAPVSPCAQDGSKISFSLQILKRNPPDLHGDTTGFAVLTPLWKDGESYAGVAYPMVEAAAKSLEVEIPYVLGATLAHEVGHLLLGATCHSRSGVMCPRFGREQLGMAARGELRFTSEQAVRIREEIANRTR